MDAVSYLDFLFPPTPYPVWWVVGAVLVLLVVVGWIVGVLLWTLPVEVLRDIPVLRSVTYRVLGFKFSRALAGVAQRHHAGQLETREAFHEISRIFRAYVTFRTGYSAREMTATDIANSPLGDRALDVLRMTYPGQFEAADPRGVDLAVDAARRAVAAWT